MFCIVTTLDVYKLVRRDDVSYRFILFFSWSIIQLPYSV